MDGFYENLLLTKSQFNCDVKYLKGGFKYEYKLSLGLGVG